MKFEEVINGYLAEPTKYKGFTNVLTEGSVISVDADNQLIFLEETVGDTILEEGELYTPTIQEIMSNDWTLVQAVISFKESFVKVWNEVAATTLTVKQFNESKIAVKLLEKLEGAYEITNKR